MIAAEVYLWGSRIGVISQYALSDVPQFNYDEAFLKSGIEVSPLMMPLRKGVYSFPALNAKSFYGLPGLLADSLPDKFGNRMIEKYLSFQGRSIDTLSSVERLCYTGKRGMGALEYVPAIMMAESGSETIQLDALVKLASDILSEREAVHIDAQYEPMEQMMQIGTSAGGARAKAVIAWNQQIKDIRSGQIEAGDGYEYWLIKFDGVDNNKDKGDKADSPAYTRIEYAYYLMALDAGIVMNPCQLYPESGRYHFLTKRFDRNDHGEKIHMQSLGGLAHFDFNDPGAYSYEQVCDLIYRLGLGQRDVEQIFRRMVFNVLARNQDDHVKNISFLMNRKGQWSLAPAYDLTYAYDPSNFWLARHQMSVNGKLEEITPEDILACGLHMNLSRQKVKVILEQISSGVRKWSSFAEEAKVPEKDMQQIGARHIAFCDVT